MANPILIEDAEVVFRNFAGEEKTFNDPGDRNFCIILDPELADHMKSEGWNIKTLKPRSEEEEPRPYIQVTVNYAKGRPPRVVLRSSRGATDLGADEVSVLDFSNISRWDIMLNPYHWEVKGTGTGVKAYLDLPDPATATCC